MAQQTTQQTPQQSDPATRPGVDDGRSIRLLGGASLLLLAAITAVISYQHGLHVVHSVGGTGPVAYLLPLVADTLIIGSSLALLDAAQNNQSRPRLAIVSLVFGIVATIAMNVADGWRHGVGGALVSALAPLALVLSYETLMGMVRRARQRTEQTVSPDTSGHPPATPGQCPHWVAAWVPVSLDEQVVAAFLHGRDCEDDPPSQRQLAARFDLHRDKVAALVRPLAKPDPAAETKTAAARPDPAMNGAGGR